jgi:glycosyltransferase involved in cell wall biosynthesis
VTDRGPGRGQDGAGADRTVSVVVPTRNSARTIVRCLDSILAQLHPVELIVVDNDSTDGTWEATRSRAHLALRGGPERSAQRNIGIARASGAFVLWIDSDMVLPLDLVPRAVAAATAGVADGVFIPELTVGAGFWTRCRRLERLCGLGEVLIESPRLVRRSYLQRTGGFVEWLSGTEDAELRMRMLRDGARLARTDAVILHDEGRLTLFGILAKRFYYGRGLSRYEAAHPGASSAQVRATLRALGRNWWRLVVHPLLTVGIAVMRAGELAAYLAGRAAGSRTAG